MAAMTTHIGHGEVRDIGGRKVFNNVRERLFEALKHKHSSGPVPVLPDELLYDDAGLDIWAQIINTDEFYQTADEIAIFDAYGAEVVKRLSPGVTMIDLGAGDTSKVEHLLRKVEEAKLPAVYLALDISKASLERGVKYLVDRHSGINDVVACAGLWGTFGNGMEHVEGIKSPRLFLSLGSVLCNDPWPEALNHLKAWANLLRPDDYLLVGMDGHLIANHKEKIWAAYHTSQSLFDEFFLNGFKRLNHVAGEDWFHEDDWELLAELEEVPTTRHRFYLRAKRDLSLRNLGRIINEGEEFDWFDSHKYDEENVRMMCRKAGLAVLEVYQAPDSDFRQYMIKRGKGDHEDTDSAVSGVN
ncbi:histidine-specific methyltransferase [Stachybotrys elegans]|uniref:4-dimethylallyltryptophan N-methyltransferase n=1 Tax=Stachybotrys elegans TaxID=80388 RepID=A0A8K0SQ44_9HYPO|nr:histidine-specific methyltransferase [Stachybotrys elegans]